MPNVPKDIVECPRCGMSGSAQGVKHHYTSVHNNGQPGGLFIKYVPVVIEIGELRTLADSAA